VLRRFAEAQAPARLTAVIPDDSPLPAIDDPVTRYMPSARPGSRATHVWLERNGERTSTIVLFGACFVLLTGAEGGAWVHAGARLASPDRPELVAHRIGGGGEFADPDRRWQEIYGVEPGGAVLVRPDGHVGWRSRVGEDDPSRTLKDALDRILGRV
jgi:putative polyketide hydroxylase